MKMVENDKQGKKVEGAFAYLAKTKALLAAKGPKSVEEFLDISRLEQALETRAAAYVSQTSEIMARSNADRKEKDNELFALNV